MMTRPDPQAEHAALAAGTHEPAVDDFGNQYLARRMTRPDPQREGAERSERAAAEIATWPAWMQRNLKPTTVEVLKSHPVGDGYAYEGCHCNSCEAIRNGLGDSDHEERYRQEVLEPARAYIAELETQLAATRSLLAEAMSALSRDEETK